MMKQKTVGVDVGPHLFDEVASKLDGILGLDARNAASRSSRFEDGQVRSNARPFGR